MYANLNSHVMVIMTQMVCLFASFAVPAMKQVRENKIFENIWKHVLPFWNKHSVSRHSCHRTKTVTEIIDRLSRGSGDVDENACY